MAQISQLNQLFQFLRLVHVYGHAFHELSRMLMRKNVNNDVSNDSSRLAEIDEKLERLSKLTDEFETYKSRVKLLEDEHKSMQESLGSSQTEIKEMQGLQDNIAEQQKTMEASLQRVQCELAELQRRHIKLECHSRRDNLKFYGIKEREHESNEDIEDLLTKFLRAALKIPKEDEESIQFDSVHRVSARRVYRLALRIPSHDRLLSSFPASTTKNLLSLSSKTLRKAAILELPTTFQRR